MFCDMAQVYDTYNTKCSLPVYVRNEHEDNFVAAWFFMALQWASYDISLPYSKQKRTFLFALTSSSCELKQYPSRLVDYYLYATHTHEMLIHGKKIIPSNQYDLVMYYEPKRLQTTVETLQWGRNILLIWGVTKPFQKMKFLALYSKSMQLKNKTFAFRALNSLHT